jgi:hypothetical protein
MDDDMPQETNMAPPSLAREFFDHFSSDNDEGVKVIRSMIGTKFEDDIFDAKQEPTDPDKNKRKQELLRIWSKAMSGFANAGGGVVVWGLVAKPDPVSKIDKVIDEQLVSDPEALENELRKLQGETTDPPLGGVLYRAFEAVDTNGKPGGFLVCYMPEGPFKPYRQRACDQQYFYRFGESTRVMPTHMLRQLFYPRATSTFFAQGHFEWKHREPTHAIMEFEIGIRNKGPSTAREVAVLVERWNLDPNEEFETFAGEGWNKTASYFISQKPIHPGMPVCRTVLFRWRARAVSGPNGNPVLHIGSNPLPQVTIAVFAENQEPQRFRVGMSLQDCIPLEYGTKSYARLDGEPLVDESPA